MRLLVDDQKEEEETYILIKNFSIGTRVDIISYRFRNVLNWIGSHQPELSF